MKFIQILTLSIIALFLVNSTGLQSQDQDDYWADMNNAKTDAVNELVNSTVVENKIVGYSIAILRDSELIYKKNGGFANFESQTPISSDSRYQIYSATKIFFNIAFMQ